MAEPPTEIINVALEEHESPYERRQGIVLAVIAALLVVAVAFAAAPIVAPLVLGAWFAHLATPLARRLAGVSGRRSLSAVLLTVALALFIVGPVALAVASVLPATESLIAQVRSAAGARPALEALVSDGDTSDGVLRLDYLALGKQYGASASRALWIVASASLGILVGLVVFLATFFALLVDGDRAYAWLEANAPIDHRALRKLVDAFYQSGRGILVGSGLTALAQGLLATIIYIALGVPRAFLLGALSTAFALVPLTGPAFVWAPVAAGLLLKGEVVKAVVLAALGMFVVGTVDNLLRPWLLRRANLGISSVTALVAILGGVAAFGPWGILFGPLTVRLAMTALELARARGAFGRKPAT